MADYKKREDTLSNKEKDAYSDMRIVQEMYARGFEFAPIDIFRAHSRLFQIVDGKLMPSLTSIEGMGEKAADGVGVAGRDVRHAGEGVVNGFDLALVRHALFIAREVEAHADTEQHEDACDDRRALRAANQHKHSIHPFCSAAMHTGQ